MVTRVSKPPQERKAELMTAAVELFAEKGYGATTIDDITSRVGISKGAFYYHFRTKDHLMRDLVDDYIQRNGSLARQVAAAPGPATLEKLQMLLGGRAMGVSAHDRALVVSLHSDENAELHRQVMAMSNRVFGPVLGELVEQGNLEGVFSCPAPVETAHLLLAAVDTIFDDTIFDWTPEQTSRLAAAAQTILERALGAEPGALAFICLDPGAGDKG